MKKWFCYASPDRVHWLEHPSPLHVAAFTWVKNKPLSSQVVERNGNFYWYVAVEQDTVPGKTIDVAVADSPTGPLSKRHAARLSYQLGRPRRVVPLILAQTDLHQVRVHSRR